RRRAAGGGVAELRFRRKQYLFVISCTVDDVENVHARADDVGDQVVSVNAHPDTGFWAAADARKGIGHVAQSHTGIIEFFDEGGSPCRAVALDPFADLKEFAPRLLSEMNAHVSGAHGLASRFLGLAGKSLAKVFEHLLGGPR